MKSWYSSTFYFTTLCINLWCFLLLLFIHTFVLYRGIFSTKNRLYLSALVQRWNCSRSFLTSGEKIMAKAELFLLHHWSFSASSFNLFPPKTFPAVTKRGPLLYSFPFSYPRTSVLVFLRYMKLDVCTEQSLDPDVKPSRPQSPYGLVWSYPFLSRQVRELKEDPAFGSTVLVFHSILVGSLEGGGGGGSGNDVLVTETMQGGWVSCTM